MKKLIANPLFQGFTGITSILVGIWFYYAAQIHQIPAYLLSESQLIASSPINRLKIYWDSIPLPNVKVVRIAVINAGNTYIDKANFSKTYPITIEATEKVKILDVQVVRKSRSTLTFSTHVRDTLSSSAVVLDIAGDDGLEGGDGALFEIVYTSEVDASWFVTGRVKNVPSGFVNSGYAIVSPEIAEAKKYESLKVKVIAILLISLGFTGGYFIVEKLVSSLKNKKFDDLSWIGLIMLIVCVLFCFMGVFLLNIYNVFSPITMPAWL